MSKLTLSAIGLLSIGLVSCTNIDTANPTNTQEPTTTPPAVTQPITPPTTVETTQQPPTDDGSTQQGSADRSYTFAQISLHNSKGDCWVVVRDKVFNITDFIPLHKGAPLENFCGKDASDNFNTRPNGTPHPDAAWESVQKYYIGDLTQV